MCMHVEFERLPDVELAPEVDAKITRMTEEADREIEEGQVNFYWGKTHLDPVKRAAEQMGIPWQAYIKQAAFRQAMADLSATRMLTSTDLNGPPSIAETTGTSSDVR